MKRVSRRRKDCGGFDDEKGIKKMQSCELTGEKSKEGCAKGNLRFSKGGKEAVEINEENREEGSLRWWLKACLKSAAVVVVIGVALIMGYWSEVKRWVEVVVWYFVMPNLAFVCVVFCGPLSGCPAGLATEAGIVGKVLACPCCVALCCWPAFYCYLWYLIYITDEYFYFFKVILIELCFLVLLLLTCYIKNLFSNMFKKE
ncbi:unnamed protein product [Moneuplotes crassus]|uniref:Transmembrane protein n=1 Tax=Euplotes crassus TaxID=5936 RepID=A0AAD1XXC1_EUPCR|nr:unnamed protein product [Moneuplotes crassus]